MTSSPALSGKVDVLGQSLPLTLTTPLPPVISSKTIDAPPCYAKEKIHISVRSYEQQ